MILVVSHGTRCEIPPHACTLTFHHRTMENHLMTTTLTTDPATANRIAYAIQRCEELALQALDQSLALTRRAAEYETAGLLNSARTCRKLAAECDGQAVAYDIATAVIAGTFA